MSEKTPDITDPLHQRQLALSRWENEGGAGPCGTRGAGSPGPQEGLIPDEVQSEIPQLTDAEVVQLRIRVIALENVAISLLAEASGRQLDLVREMAAYISPRPGFTHHPLTIHAADQMIDLVERASRFKINTCS